MSALEFEGWPKTPRLFRDMIVTEKIDGTNAAVVIEPCGFIEENPGAIATVHTSHGDYAVGAQSRNRLLTVVEDNAGFGRWVHEHATDLAEVLGKGRHFGEWWGSGIQRGYGLVKGDKRFSLFNISRYSDFDLASIQGGQVDVVPTLGQWTFDTGFVGDALEQLRVNGSSAAPGFMSPEGVVVYHTAARTTFKALLENDAQPKGAQR